MAIHLINLSLSWDYTQCAVHLMLTVCVILLYSAAFKQNRWFGPVNCVSPFIVSCANTRIALMTKNPCLFYPLTVAKIPHINCMKCDFYDVIATELCQVLHKVDLNRCIDKNQIECVIKADNETIALEINAFNYQIPTGKSYWTVV